MLEPRRATGACPPRSPTRSGLAFGRDLTLVALGGEVVVDYALRLAREYPGQRLWVAGYSNDVFGYVPSRASSRKADTRAAAR